MIASRSLNIVLRNCTTFITLLFREIGRLFTSQSVYKVFFRNRFLGHFAPKLIEIQTLILQDTINFCPQSVKRSVGEAFDDFWVQLYHRSSGSWLVKGMNFFLLLSSILFNLVWSCSQFFLYWDLVINSRRRLNPFWHIISKLFNDKKVAMIFANFIQCPNMYASIPRATLDDATTLSSNIRGFIRK